MRTHLVSVQVVFRVFHRPIIAKVHKVIVITKAVVELHNFLMTVNENDKAITIAQKHLLTRKGQIDYALVNGDKICKI